MHLANVVDDGASASVLDGISTANSGTNGTLSSLTPGTDSLRSELEQARWVLAVAVLLTAAFIMWKLCARW